MTDQNHVLAEAKNLVAEVKKTIQDQVAPAAERAEKAEKLGIALEAKFATMEKQAEEQKRALDTLQLMLANSEANGSTASKTVDWGFEAKSLKDTLVGHRRDVSITPDQAKAYHKAFFAYAAKNLEVNAMAPDEAKSLMIGQDSAGGYLVPPQFDRTIRTWALETSPIRELSNVMTISGPSINIPVNSEDFDADFVAEGSAGSQNIPTIQNVKIDLNRIPASPPVTIEMLEYNQVNLEQWIAERVARRFSKKENQYYLTGDGNNKPHGILSYPDGTTFGKIEQVATSAANTLKWLDLIKLNGTLNGEYAKQATIGIKRQTWFTLLTEQASTSGEYQIELDVLLMGSTPKFNFMGTPVVFMQDFATLAATPTTGVIAAVIADFRQAYQIVDRAGITLLKNPYATEGVVKFQFNKYTGGGVLNHDAVKLLKIA